MVPVGDLLGQPILDRGLGLGEQVEPGRAGLSCRCSGTTWVTACSCALLSRNQLPVRAAAACRW